MSRQCSFVSRALYRAFKIQIQTLAGGLGGLTSPRIPRGFELLWPHWDRLIAVNHALDFGVVGGWRRRKGLGRLQQQRGQLCSSATSRILFLSLSFSPSLIFPHTPSSTTLLILTTFSQRSSRRPSQHSSSTTHHHPHPQGIPSFIVNHSSDLSLFHPHISHIFSLFSLVCYLFFCYFFSSSSAPPSPSPSSSLLPLFILPPPDFLLSLCLLPSFSNYLFLIFFFNGFGYGSAHPQVKISPLSHRVSRVALQLNHQSPPAPVRSATVDHRA